MGSSPWSMWTGGESFLKGGNRDQPISRRSDAAGRRTNGFGGGQTYVPSWNRSRSQKPRQSKRNIRNRLLLHFSGTRASRKRRQNPKNTKSGPKSKRSLILLNCVRPVPARQKHLASSTTDGDVYLTAHDKQITKMQEKKETETSLFASARTKGSPKNGVWRQSRVMKDEA